MGKTWRKPFQSNVQPRRVVREQRDWVCDFCEKPVAKHWAVCPHCEQGSIH